MTNPARDLRIDLLLDAFDRAFDRRGWHGTGLRGSLRGLAAEEAAWRPGDGRNSVWELAVHCAYWKYTVRRRITGVKRGSFAKQGSDCFLVDRVDDEAWEADVRLLEDEHVRLREMVVTLPPDTLHDRVGGSEWTRAQLIQGATAHDLYHAGQIQLLKRLRQG